MIYQFRLCFATTIFDVFASIRLAPNEKYLQIVLLRQRLRILERKAKATPRVSRPEKLMFAALITRLQAQTQQWHSCLRESVLLVNPKRFSNGIENVSVANGHSGNRTGEEVRGSTWLSRLSLSRPRVRHDKIHGKLLKLGFTLNPKIVKNILRRHRGKSS